MVEGVGSLPDVPRESNRRNVLTLLRERGPLTRADLARLAGVSRSTVSSIVTELRGADLAREISGRSESRPKGRIGRPGSLVTLNPAAGNAVGIDFDHQELRVIASDLSHEVVAEAVRPLELDHDAAEAIELAALLVEDVLADAGVRRRRLIGVGMALAGPFNRVKSRLNPSSLSASWHGVDPGGEMSRRLGVAVHVDNDANLAALAEMMWGAGQGATDVAYIKADTGIGAALVLGGQLYRGALGTAGEIGHCTVAEDGPFCRCGNRGCLERFASVPAVLEAVAGSHGTNLTIDEVIGLAMAGDVVCRRVIGDAGRLIGNQVGYLCNLLNPERVVVGGALSGADDLFLEPLRASLARRALPVAAQAADVVAGSLGERASALGAVALALRRSDPYGNGTDPYAWSTGLADGDARRKRRGLGGLEERSGSPPTERKEEPEVTRVRGRAHGAPSPRKVVKHG